MDLDTNRIDDAVLALLYLTLHDEHRASKGFDRESLGRLHARGMIDNPAGEAKSLEFTPDGLERSKELFEAMFVRHLTEQLPQRDSVNEPEAAVGALQALETGPGAPGDPLPKYPNIRVELKGLKGQLWPILRRVSYAMSDADVDKSEIEQYKNEVKSGGDPVAVSRRWVRVA